MFAAELLVKNAVNPLSLAPVSYTHLDVYKRQEPVKTKAAHTAKN